MRPVVAIILTILSIQIAPAQQNHVQFASFDLASEAVLNDPHDLEIGPDGRLYVADKFANRIAIFDPDTLDLVEVRNAGQFPGVHDIDFGPDGRAVISVTGLSAVVVFDDYVNSFQRPSRALPASRVEGALAHSNGHIYAMAGGTGMLLKYESGEVVAAAPGHFGAHDVAEAPDGSVWVADNFNRRLVRYSADLSLLQVIDHSKFGFVGPRYLDVDDFGRLVVADQDAHRIVMIDPEGADGGTLVGVIGSGSAGIGPNLFDDPEGVEIQGNRYFFSDSDNNRIVRYSVVTN